MLHREPLIFQTLTIYSLKNHKSTPSGCSDLRIRKLEFVVNAYLLRWMAYIFPPFQLPAASNVFKNKYYPRSPLPSGKTWSILRYEVVNRITEA